MHNHEDKKVYFTAMRGRNGPWEGMQNLIGCICSKFGIFSVHHRNFVLASVKSGMDTTNTISWLQCLGKYPTCWRGTRASWFCNNVNRAEELAQLQAGCIHTDGCVTSSRYLNRCSAPYHQIPATHHPIVHSLYENIVIQWRVRFSYSVWTIYITQTVYPFWYRAEYGPVLADIGQHSSQNQTFL